METVVCDLCGGSNLRLIYRQPDVQFFPDRWFNVVECADCGLGFVNPRPTFDEISEYYPADFFGSFGDATSSARYLTQAKFLDFAQNIPTRRLLDIGCANGDFPRLMRDRGWTVEGVEVSANAKNIDDFPVHRMEFSQCPLNEPVFDAITAWAVLEHVHNPMRYFEKAARLLKPGGRLIFLVTNFESLSSRALFREDVPRHLYFYTKETVERYCRENGLSPLGVTTDRDIYKMQPSNILYYCVHHSLLKSKFTWEDLPESRLQYMQRLGYGAEAMSRPNLATTLRYMVTHPLAAADRVASLIFERWQVLAGAYGIMTVVAEKPRQ
jgi:SAM-dependent methyltransferase